jgi:hypothetical protein
MSHQTSRRAGLRATPAYSFARPTKRQIAMQRTESEVHVTKLRSKRFPVAGVSDAVAAADYQ